MNAKSVLFLPVFLGVAMATFARPEISLASNAHPISCQRIFAEAGSGPITVLFPDLVGPELRPLLASQSKLGKELAAIAAKLKAPPAKESKMTSQQLRQQNEEMLTRQSEIQDQMKQLDSKIYEIEQSSRDSVVARLSESLKNPISARTYQNYMQLLELTHVNPKAVVSLLSGHRGQAYDHAQTAEVLDVARGLTERGYLVVFDGDAPTAPALARVLGPRGIRVTGDPLQKSLRGETVLNIENPYLRLLAFSHAEKVVTTPDSPTGLAVVINTKTTKKSQPKRFILDPKKQWQGDLAQFYKSIEKRKPDLGIQYETDVFRFDGSDQLLAGTYDGEGKKPVFTPVEARQQIQSLSWKDLSVDELKTVTEASAAMAAGTDQLKNVGGAVIFGSAKLDPHSTQLVYSLSKNLSQNGIAVRTGGSGGAMLTANMGAFDGGAPSIGIPIIGKHVVANEHTFPTEVHSQTLATPDYTVRIPLLIQDTQLVGFVPGGMGTMKELAAVLVAMQSDASFSPKLVFAQGSYYQKLVHLLQKDFIPDFVRAQVSMIESASDLNALTKEMSGPRPQPRNERNEFPEQKK